MNGKIHVPKKLLALMRSQSAIVRKTHKEEKFRPTAMFVLVQSTNKAAVLMGKSAASGTWGLVPKGGVGKNKSILFALASEAWQEVHIPASKIVLVRYLGTNDIAGDKPRRKKKYAGKRFFIYLGKYTGKPDELRLKDKELTAYEWVSSAERFFELIEDSAEEPEARLRRQLHLYTVLEAARIPWVGHIGKQ